MLCRPGFLCEVARSLCATLPTVQFAWLPHQSQTCSWVSHSCVQLFSIFEQTCMRNCVLVCSASNDSDCWCVSWFRVRAGVANKVSACGNHWFSIFCSLNVTSGITLASTFGKWASSSCACLHHDKSSYHDVVNDMMVVVRERWR